jgi:hypothetical protein
MGMIEGCDFSTTAHAFSPSVDALRAAGKSRVGRYAVSDKSPDWRGITAAEYARYLAAGIDVFFIWEGTAEWMLGGYNAGVAAAQNAQANIVGVGAPPIVPVYFAHDIDPQPDQWAAIDACLNGCAAVMGWERVGAYGGWLLIDYLAQGGTVKWLWQTSAWQYGRGLHQAATLYQYDYNQWIDGTNCDSVRALRDNYGQASKFLAGAQPQPQPQPQPEAPAPPPPPKQKLNPKLIWANYNAQGPVSRIWRHEGKISGRYGRPDQPWNDDDGHGNKLFRFDDGLTVRLKPDGTAEKVVGV